MAGLRRSATATFLALALAVSAAPALAERDWAGIAEAAKAEQRAAEAASAATSRSAEGAQQPILVWVDPQRPTFNLQIARVLVPSSRARLLAAAGATDGVEPESNPLFAASGDVLRITEEDFAAPSRAPEGVSEPSPATRQPGSTGTPELDLDDDLENIDEVDAEDLEDFEDEALSGPVDERDPLEAINRPIFEANVFLDRWILRPVTRIYIETVPEPGRVGLSNALQNLRTPVILLNDFFQGEMSRAGATFGRFFINSLLGLGGVIDVADAMGLPGHQEDFGQTLGSYGIGGSPYLVLPLMGPTTPRDAIGKIADVAIDPLTYLTPDSLSEIETGVGLVNDRASIINETDTLEETSLDFYAAVRSFYYQNRDFEIANGRTEATSPVSADEPVLEETNYDELEGEDFESLEEDLDLL